MQTMNFNVGTDQRGLVSDVQNFKLGNDAKNWVQARQFEGEMRTVVVNVMEGTIPLNLTGTTIWFEGLMSDGKTRIIDAKHGTILSPSTGQFRFEFPYAAFATFGSYKQSFFKIVRDGKSIATLEFTLDVLVNLVEDGLVPLDYITPFQDLYEKLDIIYQNADADIKAKVVEWQRQVTELITSLNGDYAAIQLTVNGLNEKLDSVSKQIEAGGLITNVDFKPITEEIEKARGDSNSLSERMAGFISEKDLLIDDLYDDIDGGIPDYNNKPLADFKSAINPKLFNLGFGTDYHYDVGSWFHPYPSVSAEHMHKMYNDGLRKSLNILSLTDKLDAIVFNGDNADQPSNDDLVQERKTMIKEHQDFANTVFRVAQCPAFLLKGNHDNNYNLSDEHLTFTNVIHDSDFARIYQQNGKFDEVRNGNSNYYYKDFDDKKIRLIGLDSSDFPETTNADGTMIFNKFSNSGFQQNQLNWLANQALQVPDGYAVLITMHWPVNHTVYDYADEMMINHHLLKQILEDFTTGTPKKAGVSTEALPVNIEYEFKAKGNLIAVLSGHRHLDQQVNKNGVNYVLTRCSLTAGDNMIKEKRVEFDGTPSEDAFDLASVDTTTRTMTLTRFGAGSEDAKYASRFVKY